MEQEKIMKTGTIGLRTSTEDVKIIKKAGEKLRQETGKKPMTSRVIMQAVKTFAASSPDLFFVNRPAIRDADANIEQGKKLLQALLDQFAAVVPGITVTADEAQGFFGMGRSKFGVADHGTIKEFVLNKLVEGKATSVGGLQLSESMLKSLVVLPDLAPLFIAADNVFNVPMVAFQELFYWNCYAITEGKVIIMPEEVEKVKNTFRCYADTLLERQRLAKVRNLCRVLDSFLDDKTLTPSRLNIQSVCYFDEESARFEPNEFYVKFNLR